MTELRIVIPASNEAERIGPVLREYCERFAATATIVVVANGCDDATADLVRSMQPSFTNLEVIEIRSRIGKGGAVRVGFATGSEPYVGFVDADGSTQAAEFERLYGALRESGADGAIGTRWAAESLVRSPQPLERRVASRTFNALVRLLFGLRFTDTQCGAKLFRRAAVADIARTLEMMGFAFDVELLWQLARAGHAVVEVPTVWADRQSGSQVALARASWDMISAILRLRLRDTALWRVPFVESFGRSASLPVRSEYRILLLDGDPQLPDPERDALLEGLARAGATIARAPDEIRASRWGGLFRRGGVWQRVALLGWYVFASHRGYEAIAEIDGGAPWLVPRVSAKPSFLIATAATRARRTPRRAQGRSVPVEVDRIGVEAAVEAFEAMDARGAYFHRHGAQTELRYKDQGSGRWERQPLQ